ncbi:MULTISPECIES: histidine phosphatase family protein [unclassified Streptomyces]|uniref:Histidine phosphatase family protein n=1 Tax=Streptomyces johnsoniae TaxID=3075532 RepID=A0ABU2S5H9_9ACTN|nr:MULTISPECIES: histidine phosphatase family protein [unclassified Streptomyces]MDT0442875.1 histidine phosphatase family protein [Streptomyces sp. DSM 41886]ONK15646.1 Glucosyl-3-phosphoglycerate phosphatase [Streptomyces sp. MP131-18]
MLVTLVAAARSSAVLDIRFGDDRPLDVAGWQALERAMPVLLPLAAAELRYCSPTPCSRQTGDALGLSPMAQPALRDCDMGRWHGLTLQEVTAREPAAVGTWLADPRSAPHGGEPLLSFVSRVGGWLDTRPIEGDGRVVAVTEPSVIRAAMLYALKAPPQSYWRTEVNPLSVVSLSGRPGRWSLRLG